MNWINVKNKMPENQKFVLCATVHIENNKFVRDYFVAKYIILDNTWYGIPEDAAVTHWTEIEKVDIEI